MNQLFQAALEFQQYMQKEKWAFCIIGGLAVLRWGEMRITQDVDITLLSDFGKEEEYIDKLVKKFSSRIKNFRKFALKNRVLLLRASNKVSVDLSLAALPFEKKMIDRASCFKFSKNCSLRTCSAEDLIILKAFADRPQDWIDVEGILIRQQNKLETGYIIRQLTPLCKIKNAPEIIRRLKSLIKRI